MRTRLLLPLAALAAALVPATANAATVTFLSSPYASTVQVHWTATASTTERLFRAAGACTSLPIAGATDIGGETASPPTLGDLSDTPGEGVWCYYVEDDAGVGGYGTAGQVSVDTTPPTAPAAPTGASPINAAPSIAFSATTDPSSNGGSSRVDHYDVYRDGVQVNTSPISGAGPFAWSDVTGQSTAPASGSHIYQYTVKAVDGAGLTSTASAALTVVVDVGVPATPAVPTGTSPVAAAPSIAFTPSTDPADAGVISGIDHYDVYRDGVKVNASPIAAGGPYTWTDTAGQSSSPVSGSGSYSYAIVAVDAAGNDSVASPVRAIALDQDGPNTPATPTGTTPVAAVPTIGFTATTDPTVGTVTTGVNHYDVYRGGVKVNSSPITGAGPFTWHDQAGESSSPVTASGSYSYTVVAVDNVGNASSASSAKVIGIDATAPNVPTPGGATPVAATPVITFSASTDPGSVSSGVNHYDVYRNGVKVNTSPLTGAGPFTWTDTAGQSSPAVSGSGSYSYTLVATDNVGNASAGSSARVIVLDADVPNAPAAPTGATPVNAAPSIGFTASTDPTVGGVSSGVNHYDVYRNGVKVNTGSALTGAGPFTWTDTAGQSSSPASGSHSYSYTVVAVDAAGNSSAASAARVILLDSAAPTPIASAPTGLTSVSAAPTITFDATTDPLVTGVASGVDHYDVFRDGVKVNASPILETGSGTYTFSDAGAASLNPPSGPANTYVYTVKAVDSAGNVSTASPSISIFLDPTAASAPTGVTALASPTSQLPQISWSAPATPGFTIHHYNVYRAGVTSPVGVINAPATTFTESAGLADGSYTYQVVAATSGNTTVGIASAPATVVYDVHAPTAPAGVTATAALDGSITISWTAASDGGGSGVARYVVRRALSSTAPVSVADGDATCQGAVTSCTDATTLNGKLYTYSVFAVDAVGNTSAAGITAGVTARDQLAPAVPTGLAATPGDGIVDLRWAAAGADDDVAGYVLVAKAGSAAPTSEADGTRVCTAIVAGSTSCTATGLTNGSTYTFGLFALDEALNRSQPAVVSAAPNGHVSDTKAPAAVTKLKAEVKGTVVTLTWKNPADRDFDHVLITSSERAPAKLAAGKRVYSGKGTQAKTTVAAGDTRWFTVVAYDVAGNASPAATVRVAVADVVTSAFGPAPNARVHGTVRLSWPMAKGAKYYNVQLFAGKKRILVSWPGGRAFQVPRTKLKRGTTYTWYVWPGLGAKAKAQYGKLIGKNTFTFTG